jgi:sarcosine oxidase
VSAANTDVIVVGLGAMGSATTYQLARRGLRVVGIDRFHPPHDRGSTHGQTRVTRLAVGEGEEYVPFVRRSHDLWREIEAEAGGQLLHQVGGLIIAPAGDPFLETTRAAAVRFGIEHRNLSGRELTSAFPMFSPPPGTEAYFEPEAGFARPEEAVAAQLALAVAAGAELRFGETVKAWNADADGVTVVTDQGEIIGRELVFSAGAWIRQLVPELDRLFAVYQQQLHWFRIRQGYEALRDMPIFIWEMGGGDDPFAHMASGFYGFPAIDGPDGGVKLATERYEASVDPDARPDPEAGRDAAEFHVRHLAERFPWVDPSPVRSAACLYTAARDSRFLIDRHPGHANVMLVSPCSGHGFKHSAAIGEAVAQRINGESSELNIAPFALAEHPGA